MLRRVHVTRFCRGEAISITYSEYVSVYLVTQHAKRMRSFILSSATCLASPYFSTFSRKQYDCRKILLKFEKKYAFVFSVQLLYNFCTTSVQLLFEMFIVLKRTDQDIINVRTS